MTNIIPHLRIRDGVYQFERRVPLYIRRDAQRYADLFSSKPLYRVSLRTKVEAEAVDALVRERARFERMIAEPNSPHVPPIGTRTLTNDDLSVIAQRYCDITAAPFERMHKLASIDPRAADELERMEYELGLDGDDIRAALQPRPSARHAPIRTPLEEAGCVVQESGFKVADSGEEFGAIVAAIRVGKLRGYGRIGQLGEGNTLPALAVPPTALPGPDSGTLKDAVDRYLSARKPSAKLVSETRLALRQFEEAVGRKSLAAITRRDVHCFVEHLAEKRVGGKTKGSVARHLSETSIGKRMRMLKSAIDHARDSGQFDGDNPITGVKIANFVKHHDKTVMPEKRRLRISELNAIFAHPWFVGCRSPEEQHSPGDHLLDGCEYWGPIVAAFTGCRAAELGGMKITEVRLDHSLPHFIVRPNEFRGTKNGRSPNVPILDALLELGFADYFDRVAKSGAVRLFPDWEARARIGGGPKEFPAWSNAKMVRAFNRTVIPTALVGELSPDMRREVTFHSLRGAFKAMLVITNGISSHIANEVIGHANSDLDRRYIGAATIEETYPKVHACRYPGLILPPRFKDADPIHPYSTLGFRT